ncbi:hypothetical protein CHL78_000955 [Romboutsia weinsteinii]|uniref:CopG family transcriptional regulator n=1 Tax=Romboutsia weinsteinii TaxID=2020949 RepID=A0A371JAH5_9FIRM|nr:hypothetical protein [Romboutsia weinsteinii]RDY29771.1 hypothetical protein CHL78_000955 [Romboutsia weinsteinii]
MSKPDKVQVKLIFEGDMLKVLQDICEEECRSITQQVQYIVKKYLKDDLNKLKVSDSRECNSMVQDTIKEEPQQTIDDSKELIEDNKEQSIDDDIMDFFN